MDEQQPRVNSGWAIASSLFVTASLVALAVAQIGWYHNGLDLLLLLCVCTCPVIGFLSGIIALVHIGRNCHTVTGLGWAVAGTISGAGITVLIIMTFFVPRRAPFKTSCLNNLKQIGTAINMYESDWDDRYPLVSGPGREFERVFGMKWNYRTNSTRGERRWLQNLVAPYAKNKKIFMCHGVGEDGKWICPGGTVRYWANRHGTSKPYPDDPNGTGSPKHVAPASNSIPSVTNDPCTSYWFNAVTIGRAGKGGTKVISGRSEEICDKTADAPLVWDTPCGFDAGTGLGQVAHQDAMNVLYADCHAKPLQIPNARLDEWTKNHFGNTHGYEGWFPE